MEPNFTQNHRNGQTATYHLTGETLYLSDSFVIATVDEILPALFKELQKYSHPFLRISLDKIRRLDSAGVVILNSIKKEMQQKGVSVEIEGGSDSVQQILHTFTIEKSHPRKEQRRPYLLEWIGEGTYSLFAHSVKNFFFLMSDIFYWSVVDFFRRKTYRRGEFINQSVLIGVNAVPIVGAMAFLIGLVLALQSTAQLRQFGANRFLVDLVVIAMMREMGPLITAIIVAGRSGSAIASEVATMKITEELDGLTTMSLDPVRFVVIPKMYASIFTMPFLTILADILGIAGGMVIAFFYMDITPRAFLNRMEDVLYFRDIVTGLIKSLVFSTIIVVTGSYFGFRAARGAEEVGKVTTAAVVLAISLVIVADSILGLMFY